MLKVETTYSKPLSAGQKELYKKCYQTYLKNKDFINEHDYLLSGEAQGYRGSQFSILIPARFKKLEFTDKQKFVIEKYLFSEKTLKEVSLESGISRTTLNSHLSRVRQKLDDERTSIYWSEGILEKAIKTYSDSFSNHGFSSMLIHRLIRKADVTNVVEFLEKPITEYQKIFTEGSKIREEVEERYKALRILYKEEVEC